MKADDKRKFYERVSDIEQRLRDEYPDMGWSEWSSNHKFESMHFKAEVETDEGNPSRPLLSVKRELYFSEGSWTASMYIWGDRLDLSYYSEGMEFRVDAEVDSDDPLKALANLKDRWLEYKDGFEIQLERIEQSVSAIRDWMNENPL